MKFKKIVPILALALIAAGSAAEAQPPPPPAGQVEAWDSLRAERLEKIGPLQDKLWAKEMEYEALTRNGNQSEVKAVIDDMVKLRGQIRAEKSKLFDQMKEKGLTGRGPGGRGPHHGFRGEFGPDGWDCPCGDWGRGKRR